MDTRVYHLQGHWCVFPRYAETVNGGKLLFWNTCRGEKNKSGRLQSAALSCLNGQITSPRFRPSPVETTKIWKNSYTSESCKHCVYFEKDISFAILTLWWRNRRRRLHAKFEVVAKGLPPSSNRQSFLTRPCCESCIRILVTSIPDDVVWRCEVHDTSDRGWRRFIFLVKQEKRLLREHAKSASWGGLAPCLVG